MSCVSGINSLHSKKRLLSHPVCQAFCKALSKEHCLYGPYCPSGKKKISNKQKQWNVLSVKNESMMFSEIGWLKVKEPGRPHERSKVQTSN